MSNYVSKCCKANVYLATEALPASINELTCAEYKQYPCCDKCNKPCESEAKCCRNCMRCDYCCIVSEASDIAPENYKREDGEITRDEFARFKGEFCCSLWEVEE